jgi:hypothetical protein
MADQHEHGCHVEREHDLAHREKYLPAPELVQVGAEHRAGKQRGDGVRGDEEPGQPRVAGPRDDEQGKGDRSGVDGQPGYCRRSEQRVTVAANAGPGHACAIGMSGHILPNS